MKKSIIFFIICTLFYIANIVIICVFGASLVNNIMGWVCCIILAIGNLLLEFLLGQRCELLKKDRDFWIKVAEVRRQDYYKLLEETQNDLTKNQ